MSLRYKNNENVIIKRLQISHDTNKSKIRAYFFEKEYEFFRKHIIGEKVLVAGSGLGHDSFELAKYNKEVIGIEILDLILEKSNDLLKNENINNVKFIKMDFNKLNYPDSSFDAVVLNMGTISDFFNKSKIIKELLRVADIVYLDFYPPSKEGFEKRKKMYEEEGWINVKVEGKTIVSDDGLESASISEEEMTKIVNSTEAKAKYYPLCDFATMAEIKKTVIKNIINPKYK